MSINDFDPEILQDFLTESGELLEELESDLVDLEATPQDPELLNQIFRALHTIKGSASFLALTNLVAIAHCSESALNVARNGDLIVGKVEMDLLLASVDILKIQFEEISGGNTELTAADPELIRKLTILGDGKSLDESTSANDTAESETGTNGELNQDSTSISEAIRFRDGRSVQTVNFDSSKLDLIEHMAADINETITQSISRFDELYDESTRSAASCNLMDLFEDISKTVDFFEVPEVLTLANTLTHALDKIESLSNPVVFQLVPRLHAVCLMLNEQTKQLIEERVVTWPTESMIERITSLSNGDELTEGVLEEKADHNDAFLADDINFIAYDSADLVDEMTLSVVDTQAGGAVQDDQKADTSPSKSENSSNAKTINEQKAGSDTNNSQQIRKANVGAIEQTIRVEVSRLESLMNLVGELVLQKNRIGAMSEDIARSISDTDIVEQMEVTASTLDRVTGDIQLAVMRTRMQPLDKLFGKYPRLIRDLATKTDKQIQLEILGGDTEVDKSVIEELGDPLVHLLRNSADHGIENPQDRSNAGKDPTGTIKLVAGHEGNHVSVQIIDDGKGLSRDVIGSKAVERGLVSQEQLASLSDEEVFRFILEPGFSTAVEVSDLSGRGVGMDVVRTNIESKLKGSISIESVENEGTTINISIPLTIAIMPAMMVAVADEVFAIPLTNITEIVHPSADMLSELGDEPVIHLRGSVHPLISSQDIFAIPEPLQSDENFVVVIGFNQKIIGLRVSRVIGQQEIVIKPLDGVQRQGPISGATVRNDGGVSLIMDVAELMRISRHQRTPVCSTH
jgi:two-component system, chemotaxis family, sensor kinase CheA